ncbi:hypothetical protein V6Z88_001563 [Aspergillus fumigatus]
MDETTPLLPGQNDHNDEDTTATRLTRVSRIIAILIWSSIITSAVTFLYSLAVYLVVKLSLYYVFFSWGMRDTIEMLLPLSFLCAVVSLFGIFKLTVPSTGAWLFVNFIFDLLIVFLLLANIALSGSGVASWGQCVDYSRKFPAPGFEGRCNRFANAIKALILVGLVFEMALMSLHLVFFIYNVVLGVKRLVQYSRGWRFPMVRLLWSLPLRY